VVAVAIVAVVLEGCGVIGGPRVCPDEVKPGIRLEVVSAVDGTPQAHSAKATAIGEDGSVTMFEGSPIPAPEDARILTGGVPGAGQYMVEVEKDGFEPWTRSGVQVRSNNCGLMTTEVLVELVPTGA